MKTQKPCESNESPVESPAQVQPEAQFVGCSPENEQRTTSSTEKSVANIQPDPESIYQDSPKPDASISYLSIHVVVF